MQTAVNMKPRYPSMKMRARLSAAYVPAPIFTNQKGSAATASLFFWNISPDDIFKQAFRQKNKIGLARHWLNLIFINLPAPTILLKHLKPKFWLNWSQFFINNIINFPSTSKSAPARNTSSKTCWSLPALFVKVNYFNMERIWNFSMNLKLSLLRAAACWRLLCSVLKSTNTISTVFRTALIVSRQWKHCVTFHCLQPLSTCFWIWWSDIHFSLISIIISGPFMLQMETRNLRLNSKPKIVTPTIWPSKIVWYSPVPGHSGF